MDSRFQLLENCSDILQKLEMQEENMNLKVILESQESVLETIVQENEKISQSPMMLEIFDMMRKAKVYKDKMEGVKGDMKSLNGRVASLKERALKLCDQEARSAGAGS